MSNNTTDICGLLRIIRSELEEQLSRTQREINLTRTIELGNLIPNRILSNTDPLPSGATDALNILSNSLNDSAMTRDILQIRLNEVRRLLTWLCPHPTF